MSKLVSAVALLSFVVWSVPALAFDPAVCKQHCAESCSGKSSMCLSNCTHRCDNGGRH
jgi:hypothetical protein